MTIDEVVKKIINKVKPASRFSAKNLATKRFRRRKQKNFHTKPDFGHKFKNDRNYLLKYFAYRLQCIKKEFEFYKPDYFIPAVAMAIPTPTILIAPFWKPTTV